MLVGWDIALASYIVTVSHSNCRFAYYGSFLIDKSNFQISYFNKSTATKRWDLNVEGWQWATNLPVMLHYSAFIPDFQVCKERLSIQYNSDSSFRAKITLARRLIIINKKDHNPDKNKFFSIYYFIEENGHSVNQKYLFTMLLRKIFKLFYMHSDFQDLLVIPNHTSILHNNCS